MPRKLVRLCYPEPVLGSGPDGGAPADPADPTDSARETSVSARSSAARAESGRSTSARSSLALLSIWIGRFEEVLLAGGILLIAGLTIANVIGRTLGSSLAAAEELSQFAIIFVTFIGIGHATRTARQIRMTAIYDSLPEPVRKPLALFIAASTSLLLAGAAWLAVRYTLFTVRELGAVSPVLQAPLWVVYLSAPLGLALGSVQYALGFVKNLIADGVWLSFEHEDGYEDEIISEI